MSTSHRQHLHSDQVFQAPVRPLRARLLLCQVDVRLLQVTSSSPQSQVKRCSHLFASSPSIPPLIPLPISTTSLTMSSSASKRPRDDNDGGLPYEGTSAAPKKARDWRDAFLDEGSERSHAEADHRRHRPHAESRYRRDEDRERVHYRDHDEGRKDHGRHSGSGGGRVSNDDHRRQSHDKAGRSNKYPGGHVRSGSRDDDRGLPYGDAAGPSRSARRPQGGPAAESYADHGQMSGMKGGAVDREEGE